jgi:SAM-dependent methyltransferase
MSDNFYRAFEDIHRGARSDIIRRLQIYLSFVLPVAKANPSASCLDLGCGRGEWLELLSQQGLAATGVDLDAGMLAAAQSMGLQVRQADAIQALKDASDGSIAVVSAFHLVEHLSFECMQELVIQAKRVLVPGGLLIMETPNPDNLRVATNNFYLDPSHIKPIPSSLLSFVSEHAGFARTKIVGLQESPSLRFQPEVQLEDVLAGASPDYAVIAQTSGLCEAPEQLNAAFEREYGLTTAELAQSYNSQQTQTIRALRKELNVVRELMQGEVNHFRQLHQQSDEHFRQIQMQIDLMQRELDLTQNSVLCRIAGLLRWLVNQYVKLRQHGLKTRWVAFLRKFGWLKAKSSHSDQAPD